MRKEVLFVLFSLLSVVYSAPWNFTVKRIGSETNFSIREIRAKGIESLPYIITERWGFVVIPDIISAAVEQCQTEEGWELLWASTSTSTPSASPQEGIAVWIACVSLAPPRRLQWTLHRSSRSLLGSTRLPLNVPLSRVWLQGRHTQRDGSGGAIGSEDSQENQSEEKSEISSWSAVPLDDVAANLAAADASQTSMLELAVPVAWQRDLLLLERRMRAMVWDSSADALVWTRPEGFNGVAMEASTLRRGLSVGVPLRLLKAAWNSQGDLLVWETVESNSTEGEEPPETNDLFGWTPVERQEVSEEKLTEWESTLPQEYCNPFDYRCQLTTVLKCKENGYIVNVTVRLHQLETGWKLTFTQSDRGACDLACSVTVRRRQWVTWLTGLNRRNLEKQTLFCLKSAHRGECFIDGREFPSEILSPSLIPFLAPLNSNSTDTLAEAFVGELETLCGVQKILTFPRGNTAIAMAGGGVHTRRS